MAVRTATHPTRDTLAAFNRGSLPEADRAEVEAHIASCDACCSALAGLSDDPLVGLARQAAAEGPPTADTVVAPQVPPELTDHPRYRVLGELGAGGMGVVYKAEHRLMGRVVALKVVGRRYTANPAAVERFRREVRAAARLDHPNIVKAHDADEANGLHFLVMEYVEGVSLDRLVARRGPLPVSTACQCIRLAALGLQHAHEKGLVHRDIKPHNLMVTRKGQVKVLDFGLARFGAEVDLPLPADAASHPDQAVTTPSLVLGTPDYLAPEQAKNAHTVDIRADLYSLGCVLYFLLTGKPPFARFTGGIEKMVAHVEDEPEPVRKVRPEVPDGVAEVLSRMMAKDPTKRFANPGEVAAALKPFTQAGPVIDDRPDVVEPPPLPAAPTLGLAKDDTETDPPLPPKRRGSRKRRRARRPWPLIAAGTLAGVAALAVALFLAFGDRGPSGRGNPDKVGGGSGTAGGTAPVKKVLFVVPHQGLWYADYGPTTRRLRAAQLEVVTASTEKTPCLFKGPAGNAQVTPELLVTDVNPSDYSAVLFCGQTIWEYFTDTGAPRYLAVARIVREMRADDRVIGAICYGQDALIRLGVIPGVRKPGVRTDGRIITAAVPEDAEEFADAVVAALANVRK